MTHELIILREELEKLAKLPTITEDEIEGICLYNKATNSLPYDSIGGSVITERGKPGKVTSDGRILSNVNKFLEQNPNYGYVEFHTHSTGTIKMFGNKYNYALSDGDVPEIRSATLDDPDYRHLLITPKLLRLVRYDRRTDSIVELPIPRQVDLDLLYQLREYISRSLNLL